jgi:hypothetical protein
MRFLMPKSKPSTRRLLGRTVQRCGEMCGIARLRFIHLVVFRPPRVRLRKRFAPECFEVVYQTSDISEILRTDVGDTSVLNSRRDARAVVLHCQILSFFTNI